MGCFNGICGISSMNIQAGTPIYFGFIVPTDSNCKSKYFASNYNFISPLFETEYNDYGMGTITDDYAGGNPYLDTLLKNLEEKEKDTILQLDVFHRIARQEMVLNYNSKFIKQKEIFSWMARKDVVDELWTKVGKPDEYFKEELDLYISDIVGNCFHDYTGLNYWFKRLYKNIPREDFKKECEKIRKVSLIGDYCNQVLTPYQAYGNQEWDLKREETFLKVFADIAQKRNKYVEKEYGE